MTLWFVAQKSDGLVQINMIPQHGHKLNNMNKNQKSASLRNTSNNSSSKIVVDFHTNIYLWAAYK